VTLLDEVVDLVLQQLVPLPDRQLALEIEDRDIARGSFFDLYQSSLRCPNGGRPPVRDS
jgi:hypothetical protein